MLDVHANSKRDYILFFVYVAKSKCQIVEHWLIEVSTF